MKNQTACKDYRSVNKSFKEVPTTGFGSAKIFHITEVNSFYVKDLSSGFTTLPFKFRKKNYLRRNHNGLLNQL
jgi:predicted nucleic-acid-binding Zn-ribbon protein